VDYNPYAGMGFNPRTVTDPSGLQALGLEKCMNPRGCGGGVDKSDDGMHAVVPAAGVGLTLFAGAIWLSQQSDEVKNEVVTRGSVEVFDQATRRAGTWGPTGLPGLSLGGSRGSTSNSPTTYSPSAQTATQVPGGSTNLARGDTIGGSAAHRLGDMVADLTGSWQLGGLASADAEVVSGIIGMGASLARTYWAQYFPASRNQVALETVRGLASLASSLIEGPSLILNARNGYETWRGIGQTSGAVGQVLLIAVGAKLAAPVGVRGGVQVGSGMGGSAPASIVRSIAHGERIADLVAEGKALTFSTGNEHALVRLSTGERVLVSGGPTGIDLGGLSVERLIAHSHPYHLPPTGPSAADLGALKQLGQRSSFLLEHGHIIRFFLVGQ
jgi:hypothetical protein